MLIPDWDHEHELIIYSGIDPIFFYFLLMVVFSLATVM